METYMNKRKKFSQRTALGLTALITAASFAPPVYAQSTVHATENTVDAGSSVNSSDYNLAVSMLFQWWGLFETPHRSQLAPYIPDMFSEKVEMQLGETVIRGLKEFETTFAAISADTRLAHHIHSVRVSPLPDGNYGLEADFVYQAATNEREAAAYSMRYQHRLAKSAEGQFVFTRISAKVIGKSDDLVFQSSFIENRARATVSQYLGVTDILESDYTGLKDILSPDARITGMIPVGDTRFNDRGDGSLTGLREIPAWLASRKASFSQVSHRIASLSAEPLANDRIRASLVISTQAWPLNGEKIEVQVPVTITLVDNGERYARIESIAR